jgi:hypothetical protein
MRLKKAKLEKIEIKEMDASYIYITDFYSGEHPCKIVNLDNGIGLISKIPLFLNDHLIIKYKYKNIEFKHEAIVKGNYLPNIYLLNFLNFSIEEQKNLDRLIKTASSKRF